MDKMTINGVEFTEEEIKAIHNEYWELYHEAADKEESYGYNESLYDAETKKVVGRFRKLRKLVEQFDKEEDSRREIFKEQLEMKIAEALKEDKQCKSK